MNSELIAGMKSKVREQCYLLDILDLWAVAKEAGFESQDVKSFTFRPEFMTPEQKQEDRESHRKHRYDKYNSSNWHNCVRLKDGTLKSIPMTKRPKK